MRAKGLLPVLLLVSGFCGISYEILYTKLLGNLLGNRFTISASVLLTFLLGIGLGTLYAHRFVRKLWAIEAGIGLYAAAMVVSYGWLDRLLYTSLPQLGTSIAVCAAVSIVLLAVPAFLVGCSVPLFAAYLSTVRSRFVFSTTYGIYNFGAALTALTMEFAVLRVVGLRTATLWLALLNVVVAAVLLLLVRSYPLIPPPRADRLHFASRNVTALVLASVGSAVFQLLMIKVAEFIFGPYNETFSLVLAVVLLGIAVGSIAAGRLGLSFAGALLLALAGLASLLLFIGPAVGLYAELYGDAVKSYPLLVALKFGLVALLMGLPSIGFGATIPALLREHRDVARESGQLLFASSMGNVIGFVLMAFVLHRYLDYGPILLVVAGLALLGLVFHGGARRPGTVAGSTLMVAALVGQLFVWDETLLYYGHTNFHSPSTLERAREVRFTAERYKGPQDVFAIVRRNGRPYFFINGYISIPLSSASEKIVGALSTLFAPRNDRAMVLGIGSGATAGTVGLLFDEVDAVEINAVILQNLHRMSDYNFDIEQQPSVNIVHDDGIHFVKTTPKRYSLILNTVTTPLYFSSSKLYTRDFFEAVSEKLTPDGVYTTWVDRKIGDLGVDIILATLDETFANCWMTYLKSSYYLLVCSNGEIAPRGLAAVTANERLSRTLAERHEIPLELLPYSVLSTEARSLQSQREAFLNTMDFPALEHEMARLDSEVRLLGFKERMIDRLDLREVQRVMSRDVAWDPGGFAFWGDIRVTGGTTLGQVLKEIVPRQFGDVGEGYKRTALAAGEAVGTADGWYAFGARLYRRNSCSGAMEAFVRAIELDPEMRRPRYYLGRCYERMGDAPQAEEQYLNLLSMDPDYERAREALARVRGETDGGDARDEPELESGEERD